MDIFHVFTKFSRCHTFIQDLASESSRGTTILNTIGRILIVVSGKSNFRTSNFHSLYYLFSRKDNNAFHWKTTLTDEAKGTL